MGSVGLLYVGAVLFLNGLMLLGYVNARSAAPLNVFVGAMQVITPTWLIFTSRGDPDVILNASGLYLFGFTYLYVAWNLLAGLDGTGLGYFSLFVAICACVYAGLNFGRLGDTAFGVIWLMWAFLWALFFLVLGPRQGGAVPLHRSGRRDRGMGHRCHPRVPPALRTLGRLRPHRRDRPGRDLRRGLRRPLPQAQGPRAGPEGTLGRRRAQPRVTRRATAS